MATDFRPTVLRLLQRFGKLGTAKLLRRTETQNIGQGSVAATTKVVNLNSAIASLPRRLLANTRVQNGDIWVIMTNAVKPSMKDRIQVADKEYQIILVDGANVGGVDQYYEVVCRG